MTERDLKEIKEKLLQMREEVIKNINETVERMSKTKREEGDTTDMASLEEANYMTFRLTSRDNKFLKKIEETLRRIENGTYGICEMCGEEIPLERLKARPVTNMCIKCKELQEEEEKKLQGSSR